MTQSVSSSIDIAAPPEKVWALISDLPRMGEWSPENKGGSWKGGATGAVAGAKFKGKNQHGKKKWSIGTVVIKEAAAPNRLEFGLVTMGLKGATWRYEIDPTSDGCRVTETWVDTRSAPMRPDAIGKMITGVADRVAWTKTSIETTLANLKKAAESSA